MNRGSEEKKFLLSFRFLGISTSIASVDGIKIRVTLILVILTFLVITYCDYFYYC